MGSKKSGNPKAKGTKGNKGGTGRPPKTGEALTERVTFRVSNTIFQALSLAAVADCKDTVNEYARQFVIDHHQHYIEEIEARTDNNRN